MRLLTPQETRDNLDVALTLSTHFIRSNTLKPEHVRRFMEAGALIYPVLAEPVADAERLPTWVPLDKFADPAFLFVPRAHLICFILGPEGRDQIYNSAPITELTPWRPGDASAHALMLNVYSLTRNGTAKLVVGLSEQLETHPAFEGLTEMVWYTRTAKGLAMSQYFAAEATGKFVTRTFPNGDTQAMPLYSLQAADWRRHVDSVIEKLMGIEDNFSDELSDIHKSLRGQLPHR